MGVHFSIRLPVAGPFASPESVARVAHRAEELMYDSVSVHDFLAWSTLQNQTHISCGSVEAVEAAGGPDSSPTFLESLMSLAYTSALTTRTRLLVSVLVLSYRNPIVAAKQLATLDVLSGGRLILGLGAGAARSTHSTDFELLGVSRREKYDRTMDYFRAMRAIWTQDRPSYDGPFISFAETQMDPKPVQKPHPPIWIGGGGPRSMAIAAEIGDGWIPPWIAPGEYPARIEELHELATTFGRHAPITVGTTTQALIATSDQEARTSAARTLEAASIGFAADATPEAVRKSGLIGSSETLGELIEAYVAAGLTAFELRFIYHSVDHYLEQLEQFATEVMGRFPETTTAA